MIVTVHGVLCKIDQVVKNDGKVIPCIYVFSGDETLKISNVVANPSEVGSTIHQLCEIKDREYEGRKYKSIIGMEEV